MIRQINLFRPLQNNWRPSIFGLIYLLVSCSPQLDSLGERDLSSVELQNEKAVEDYTREESVIAVGTLMAGQLEKDLKASDLSLDTTEINALLEGVDSELASAGSLAIPGSSLQMFLNSAIASASQALSLADEETAEDNGEFNPLVHATDAVTSKVVKNLIASDYDIVKKKAVLKILSSSAIKANKTVFDDEKLSAIVKADDTKGAFNRVAVNICRAVADIGVPKEELGEFVANYAKEMIRQTKESRFASNEKENVDSILSGLASGAVAIKYENQSYSDENSPVTQVRDKIFEIYNAENGTKLDVSKKEDFDVISEKILKASVEAGEQSVKDASKFVTQESIVNYDATAEELKRRLGSVTTAYETSRTATKPVNFEVLVNQDELIADLEKENIITNEKRVEISTAISEVSTDIEDSFVDSDKDGVADNNDAFPKLATKQLPEVKILEPAVSLGNVSQEFSYTVRLLGAGSLDLAGKVFLAKPEGLSCADAPQVQNISLNEAVVRFGGCSGDGIVRLKIAKGGAKKGLSRSVEVVSGQPVTVDNTAPQAPSLSSPSSASSGEKISSRTPTWQWSSLTNGSQNFRFKLGDDDFEAGGEETIATSYTPTSALPYDTYTLYVQQKDAAQNWSLSASYTITIEADSDSDGVVDSDDECPTEGTKTLKSTYYNDLDNDGFGDPAVTELACEPSSGYVDNDEDFDDSNLYINKVKDFVTTWNVTSGQTITLPLVNSGSHNYNFEVDWGDGSPNGMVTSWDDPDAMHTYTAAGTYTVRILGLMEWFSCDGVSGIGALTTVEDMGHTGLLSLERAFKGCIGLTSFKNSNSPDAKSTNHVDNMQEMFFGLSNLTSLDFTGFSTENVFNIQGMFEGFTSAVDLDLSSFNVSLVYDMSRMFAGASPSSLNISSFGTSTVSMLSYMFEGYDGGAIIGIETLNVSGVFDFSGMFQNYGGPALILSGWDTSTATNMNSMFKYALMTDLDISHFNMSSVTNMGYMFYGSNFSGTLNIEGWDTSNATNTTEVFGGLFSTGTCLGSCP